MDGHGHGTHVAGIIASGDPNLKGVAPDATIMAVKVLTDEGSGTYESVIAGVEWAVRNGANVINLSLGGPGGYGNSPLAVAVDNAVKSGIFVAVAAGNSGPDMQTIGTPGDARLATTVGSVHKGKVLNYWSSRGPTLDGRVKPDVMAYGNEIVSLAPENSYETMSGTSMATPHVAGVAALLMQEGRPDPLLVKEALKETAVDLGYGQNWQGAGLIDPKGALTYIRKAMNVVQQEVYPGETAVFDYLLYNRGNVDDTFRITRMMEDRSLQSNAASTSPADSVQAFSEVPIASGDSVQGQSQVRIRDDWAGMEDTIYIVYLRATSVARAGAEDEDRAAVRVKATKRSMAEYIREELEELQKEIRAMETDGATKKSLYHQATDLYNTHLDALTLIKAQDEAGANTNLDAAAAKAGALERDVAAKEQAGRLTAEQGKSLRSRIADIQDHIALCRKTSNQR